MKKKDENILNFEKKENKTIYTLKDNTYLSDTFDKTPNGIVIKNNTGIGATTLELGSERNSIVVEPLKATASLKAKKEKDSYYVGSKTEQHSSDFNKEKLREYLDNSSIKYKKIIVVADSLPKLFQVLNEEEKKSFFLMIDESDSFQLDTCFRESMSACYEIYKKHPKELRCLLTATPIKFNDPELKDEEITDFKHETEQKREIKVVHVKENNKGVCVDLIEKYYSANPDQKIMVAYNSVEGLYDIAETLQKKLGLDNDKIAILCSKSNKGKVEKYYKELKGDTLPASVNLVTSAYFTGYDLNESYRLIVLTTQKDKLNQHTTDRLKQIAGRCRNPHKLYSEDIIHFFTTSTPETETEWTLELLKEQAEILLDVLRCMSSHFKSSSILLDEMEKVQQHFLKSSQLRPFGFDLLTKNDEGQYQLNYLAIDAILYFQKEINTTYLTKNQLVDKLKSEGHKIIEDEATSSIKIDNGSAIIKQNALVKNVDETTRLIEKIRKGSQPTELFEEISTQSQQNVVKKGLMIYQQWKDCFNKDELETEILKNVDKRKANDNLSQLEFMLSIYSIKHIIPTLSQTFENGTPYSEQQKTEMFKQTIEKLGLNTTDIKLQTLQTLSNMIFEFKRKDKNKYEFLKMKTFPVTCINPVNDTPDSVKQRTFSKHSFKR